MPCSLNYYSSLSITVFGKSSIVRMDKKESILYKVGGQEDKRRNAGSHAEDKQLVVTVSYYLVRPSASAKLMYITLSLLLH